MRAPRPTRLAGGALLLAAVALAQTFPNITIERETSSFFITNRGDPGEGARSIPFLPGCEEDVSLLVYYGPGRTVETVIDDDTTVTSSVVLVRRPAEGAEEGADQETIELLDSAAAFEQRPPCLASLEAEAEPEVRLVQGRTAVAGERLFLDQETNVALMDGPVSLDRAPEGDGPRVLADADELEFDLDTDQAILVGNVRVTAGDRVSEADRLELNEAEGLAVLTGDPARSTEGESVLEGERLLYYLDSNEVIVEGSVRGTLEIEGP